MVVFAPHNLIRDPPFTNLDVVSCRNLLIYFSPELQRKLVPLFHYSLNPGGLLLLGSAESMGGLSDRFAPVDRQSGLHRRIEPVLQPAPIEFPLSSGRAILGAPPPARTPKPPVTLPALLAQMVLERYAPSAVLVNDKGDILCTSGRTGKYLEPAVGKVNWNVLAMARNNLSCKLAAAFRKALRQPGVVGIRGAKVKTDGDWQMVDFTVERLEEPEAMRGMVMIVFTDIETVSETPAASRSKRALAGRHRVEELERELQRACDEQQATCEEMRISHEQLNSVNEELQSANEELTTSKEELQSLNEELQTLNSELQAKVDQLADARDELETQVEARTAALVARTAELAKTNEKLRKEIAVREMVAESLRQEINFRTGIFARAAEGLCVCNETTAPPFVEFTVWNERMREITGYTMEEINRLGWYRTMYNDPNSRARGESHGKDVPGRRSLRRGNGSHPCRRRTQEPVDFHHPARRHRRACPRPGDDAGHYRAQTCRGGVAESRRLHRQHYPFHDRHAAGRIAPGHDCHGQSGRL